MPTLKEYKKKVSVWTRDDFVYTFERLYQEFQKISHKITLSTFAGYFSQIDLLTNTVNDTSLTNSKQGCYFEIPISYIVDMDDKLSFAAWGVCRDGELYRFEKKRWYLLHFLHCI